MFFCFCSWEKKDNKKTVKTTEEIPMVKKLFLIMLFLLPSIIVFFFSRCVFIFNHKALSTFGSKPSKRFETNSSIFSSFFILWFLFSFVKSFLP
ncbi:MAG: hypothetical protein CL844_06790 [Crocinitomicaceae bacterium]|nr:hypothetical protein [Crocinitomicaceae bacterium]